MKREKALILDGNSICFRHFKRMEASELGLQCNPQGFSISATLGYLETLASLVEQFEPDYIVACFDHAERTFRHDFYPEYKAGRPPKPVKLKADMGYLKLVLAALNIAPQEVLGFEGDDLLGSAAHEAAKLGVESIVVSGDRDTFQLVREDGLTKVYYLSNAGGELVDSAGVEEKLGVPPGLVVALKSLQGDSSDNIKGVPGVGEKTALSLIREYGSLKEILASIEKMSPKVAQKLRGKEKYAMDSEFLVRIRTDAPVPPLSECAFGKFDAAEVERLSCSYGAPMILSRLNQLQWLCPKG